MSADGWVAGHLSYRVEILSQDGDLGSDPGSGERCLDSGMAGTDDNHIVSFWVAEHG
jgi:hypothetical protein